MWLLVVLTLVAFLFYFLGVRPLKHWEQKGVPYVKPLPFVGNVGSNVIQRKAFCDLQLELYMAYPDSRYMGFYQFLTPSLMIRDPELIKKIAVKEFDTFPDRRELAPADVDPLWGKNLVSMKGQDWHDMRGTLSPAFTSSKMKMMFDLMKSCAKQFTTHYQKQVGFVEVEMKDAFSRFANDVIATTAFGINCDSLENRNNDFFLMGREATDFNGIRALRFFLGTFSPKLMKLLRIGIYTKTVSNFFRGVIKETLKVRQENGIVRPDMVHLLLEAKKGRIQDDSFSNGAVDSGFAVVKEAEINKVPRRKKAEITDEDITAQALIFFFAGFDTVSTFMCFTAHELAVNPDIQAKLVKEIDQVIEKCKGNLTYDALMGMKYLDMVVSESLRKWSPGIAFNRMSVKPFTIEPELPGEKPVMLDNNTNVWIPSFALHRDPKYYPNPEKFDPERFSDENKDKIQPYTYLPFGVGPRNCIGSRFALLEGKLVLVEILSKMEFVPVARTQIPLQLKPGSFTPAAEKGFWVGLKPRTVN